MPGSGNGRRITNLKTEVNLSVLLFNFNIQGIQNKIYDINTALLIENIKPDCISFTEQWLNKANL